MPATLRLPPLSALRVFEAAARHASFSAAAAELHVTAGAVSRQIGALERHLGVSLFHREPRGNRLTAAGVQLAERVREAFGLLRDAVRTLGSDLAQRVVVTVLPSFAARWLLPRLPAFTARHPGIEIDLQPSREIVALDRGGIDLAVRYGRGRWPGVEALRLFEETLLPVCTPALARQHRPRCLPDLLGMPLIHDSDFPWSLLFEHHRVALPRRLPGIRVDDSSLALQAAERGQGVMLGRSLLVADAIADGRLVAPLDLAVPGEFAYYLAWPRRRPPSAAAAAFRDWLLDQAQPPVVRPRRPPAAGRRG
jgi:LysR family transcriptional regulator, glycine cleavage system transcriptional activator